MVLAPLLVALLAPLLVVLGLAVRIRWIGERPSGRAEDRSAEERGVQEA
jgi:hypothetical protein